MRLDPARFRARIDGLPVGLYTIGNRQGLSVAITNYGARILQIVVPDRDGRLGDVVQGYESIGQVLEGQPSMGAFIGRYANRIAARPFQLDGEFHALCANEVSTDPLRPRRSTLHGGGRGSRYRPFAVTRASPGSVRMELLFRDGEDGFPGDLSLGVEYSVTDGDELLIAYEAIAGPRTTIANFTAHAFFNLRGDPGAPVGDTQLFIPASRVLEVDSALLPTGTMRAVAGTPMDFRRACAIGARIDAASDLLAAADGYDHYYVIDVAPTDVSVLHARAYDSVSGRMLEVWSTEPGLQFYSGNGLDGRRPRDLGKQGIVYGRRTAFCLEPSHYPDSVHHPGFPSTVLPAHGRYRGEIRYRFSTDRDPASGGPYTTT